MTKSERKYITIKFTEMTFSFIVVFILACSLVYVFGQISKVKAEHISCKAFATQFLAQKYYQEQQDLEKQGLPYDRSYKRLDGDKDGLACESRF